MAIAPPRAVVTGAPHDPAILWTLLRACVIVTIVWSLIQGALDLWDYLVAPDLSEPGLVATLWVFAYSYLAYAIWITFFVTAFFLMWLTYRLARNLHFLAPRKFTMSPTYAVGWYVVPIANIFMPPRVTGLIARDTFAAAGDTRNHNIIIGWWWAAFLVGGLLANVATLVAADAGAFDPGVGWDATAYENSLLISALAAALNVAASVLMLRVFGPIARAQTALIRAARGAT